jgi:hypothetical protein
MRATRDQIIAAQDAWQDAEKAYHDEAANHVAVWRGDTPPPTVPEPVTREALDKVILLREAAGEALAAYRDVLGES